MRVAVAIELSDEERATLDRYARGRSTPVRVLSCRGVIRRPSRVIAAAVMLLGFGGWFWVALGRECDCFGAMVRLGRTQHLVLSGLIVSAGAHMWVLLNRLDRSDTHGDSVPQR